MNGNFVFNGRSRPTHLSLSRDHQPSKDAILAETRKKRERREINRVQQQAALRIQRKARLWLSRMSLADLAFNLFQSVRDESQKTPGRRLERFCWDFEFFCRGKRRGFDHNSRRMMCTQVVLQQLRRSIRAGSVREELFGCQHGLDLLARLIFEEYA
ncbi:ubiquitin-protein ligase, partial [Trypanosoma cruzi]